MTMAKKRIYTRRDFLKTTGSLILLGSMPHSFIGCRSNVVSQPKAEKTSVYLKKLSDAQNSYDDYDLLKDSIREMVQTLYDKNAFFQFGDSVSIKVNIVQTGECLSLPAAQTYVTHPQTVKALGEVFLDLGAGRIAIIEGATIPSDTMQAFSSLGYDEIAAYLGAELVDLNVPDPEEEFQEAILEDGLIYAKVKANRSLFETDCLVSAAKLKCHSSAGISLSLKNLIGLLPVSVYGLNGTGARVEYVHNPDPTTQIPYNIIDLARLFPINFAFIDGISAIDKGEGPWINGVSFVQPGLLVASVDAVAADTICC